MLAVVEKRLSMTPLSKEVLPNKLDQRAPKPSVHALNDSPSPPLHLTH